MDEKQHSKFIIQKAIDLITSSEHPFLWNNPEHGICCPYCVISMARYLGDKNLEDMQGWELLNALAYGNNHIFAFDDVTGRINRTISNILEKIYFQDSKEGCLELLDLAFQSL